MRDDEPVIALLHYYDPAKKKYLSKLIRLAPFSEWKKLREDPA